MDAPVLALDVDGVLNAEVGWERELVRVQMHDEWVTLLTNPAVIGELDLRIDRERDGRLLAALENLGVEIVWCTTWEHAANEAIGPLYGLGPRDVLAVSEFFTGLRTPIEAKQAAIEHHFGERRLVWLDDDAWMVRHRWTGLIRRKIIAPASMWGLRRHDRERVVRWYLQETGDPATRARDLLRDAGRPDGRHREVRILGVG